MRMPEFSRKWLLAWALSEMAKSRPLVLHTDGDPYLERWEILKTRRLCIYIHRTIRSDRDRAIHDHRADNISLILDNCYHEQLSLDGRFKIRMEGDVVFRRAETAHRLLLEDSIGQDIPVITIWIKFRDRREWGFYPPPAGGWIHWDEYLNPIDKGEYAERHKEWKVMQ